MYILCRYHYDPLDRLVGLTPLGLSGTQRFYQNKDLVNEIDGETQRTIVRNESQPLAQRVSVAGVSETTLLATDQQRSPLTALMGTTQRQMAYTAYGHRTGESGLSSLLGFNGERPEPTTGHYLLGQGNRTFNPVLMRFNSPDELSPFGDGGINAYAYCENDPVNRYDPTGSFWVLKGWNSPPTANFQPLATAFGSRLTSPPPLLTGYRDRTIKLAISSVAFPPSSKKDPRTLWTDRYFAETTSGQTRATPTIRPATIMPSAPTISSANVVSATPAPSPEVATPPKIVQARKLLKRLHDNNAPPRQAAATLKNLNKVRWGSNFNVGQMVKNVRTGTS